MLSVDLAANDAADANVLVSLDHLTPKVNRRLDMSKLCEFCIKSCAERRKMTAVN